MPYSITTATNKIRALKKRIRIIQGGTSASKTVSIVMDLIHRAQSDKTPTLTSITSESFPHLRRGAMRDFLLIMKEHNYFKDKLWSKSEFTYDFETGSKIEFFSVDQPDKLRGARRDRLFINEANNIPFDAFEQLEVRTKEFIYLDYNPTNEFWAFTELNDRTDTERLILTYKDNEALSQEITDSIEQRKNRKGWWKVYGLGLLGEVEGKIFRDWKIISEIPHEAKLMRYGLNFGYTNHPCALAAIYYYNGGYILDEILYGRGISNQNIADTLKNENKALVVADSAEPKSIDEIKSYGISIIGVKKQSAGGVKSVVGSEKSFVNWSIAAVQQEKISITKRSINLIREYRNYLWQVDRDGKVMNVPEEPFHYSMDAVRYGISSLAPIINKRDLLDNLPRFPRKEHKNPAV